MSAATVTVSSTTTTKVSPNIHFDPLYAKTIPGMLKVGQILTGLIGFICCQSVYYNRYHSSFGWYTFVSMTSFWVSLVMLILYLFHIVEKLHFLPWLVSEMGYCAAWTLFYFVAGVVACVNTPYHDGAWGAAAFFAFLAMVLYGADAFLKFKAWRAGGIAQGERTTSSSATTGVPTDNPPSYPAY